jgi:hypothetical protein
MYTINVTWLGGPEWDQTLPSSFNPSKKKTATEHLIETGGQSIDEAIMSFDSFRSFPIKVNQSKPADTRVNWITSLVIEEKDKSKAEEIKDKLLENYTKKQAQLLSSDSGYRIEIEVIQTA